ncbi:sugar porter family MFS transporter [Photobacterium lutimaris]|uniref:D-xylose-proton symporter n=1 Tax=Photobacterium lutimaris TaxID=388278 RepID=A0A2T3IY47_9GAMM|nr:sugar porter family MFS transporter [Photobacterium lutimaris]PSU33520.1 MFS transporter [Photobacterium lutimaris]TDR74647.1 SP family xylose:H+ symportor-like MFS transporter [Photobacterium lutimaris]
MSPTTAAEARKHNFAYIIRICCIAALGGILLGYDTAVISGAIGPIREHFGLTSAQTGWAVSSVVLGSIIGAVSAGWSALKYGRRKTLFMAAILFMISAIGSALATTFTFYVMLRIVGGIAVGLACVVSPMYMSEVAPKDFRGRAVSMFQQSAVIGQTGVFYVNYLIAKGMSEAWLVDMGWRWMLGSEVLPAALFAGLLFLIPESPRWLVLKGKVAEAKDTLSRISNPKHADQLIGEIQASLADSNAPGKKQVSLRSPLLFAILVIGTFVAAAQQLTGINVIMYYTPEILRPITGSTENALFQTTFVGIVFILGNALGMYLIDKVGRLPLMKYGTFGCAVGMTVVGYVLYTGTEGYAALFALCLYVVSYATSWGCACWTMISEIFPNSIRSRAMSIAVGAQWFTGFIVTQSFPMLNDNAFLREHFNGAFSFWLFAILSLICMFVVVKFVPETKGVSLEKMEEVMAKKLGKKVPAPAATEAQANA